MNAVEIEEAISELAGQPFDPAEFPYAFLEAFGNKATTIKRLRKNDNNKSDAGGVLQRNNIHVVVCEEGNVTQALNKLKESPATTKSKAKFVLATDGKEFQAEDVLSGETIVCDYPDFHNHFGFFLPLAGISTVKQIRENSFDIKATSRLNKLYIELLRDNPEWSTEERRHDMNHFLARLIFCFFAEDTDIFNGDNLFTQTVQQMSASDASDTHEVIGETFRAMNVKIADRQKEKIKNWANGFPYVNGGLFSGNLNTPKFSKISRSYLLHVGNLDWQKINPDIFGSMIQAVADDEERGALGMHYTSVPNILKVLNPLFLDDLREQLEEAGTSKIKLLNLRKRIARIRVFDPACGSGNFLVIAYKEMRAIEREINERRGECENRTEIPLTNFRGIELRDFSAEIARLALIIAEYQCDVLYRGKTLALAEFLPLNAENWITCDNALRVDWLSICPPTGKGVKFHGDDLFSGPLNQAEIDFENEGGETYICGNPPFSGSVQQENHQKDDMAKIFSNSIKSYKDLDYVAAFFYKAAQYINLVSASTAFVSTNSVCQGEQVEMLWKTIFSKGIEIIFAHTSFEWFNLASNNAGVTCIIVGFGKNKAKKFIYSGDFHKEVTSITPYLTSGETVIVKKISQPMNCLPQMVAGNIATDGGNLLLSFKEKEELLLKNPESKKFIKKFTGANELTNGKRRWCLWIDDKNLEEAMNIGLIRERIKNVKEVRISAKGSQAKSGISKPHRFVFIPHQEGMSIVVPKVSTSSREYLPIGLVDTDTIVSDLARVIYNPQIWNLAILSSKIHLCWIATVCGRFRTGYRYSHTLGWNTFPVPPLTEKNKEDLTACAEEILIARERHFPATIAELYDPENMPEDLRRAHERNDEVLERIYIGRRFKNDTERLEKLFDLYTQMTTKQKKAS